MTRASRALSGSSNAGCRRPTSTEADDAPPDWGGSKRVLDVLRPGWPVEDDFLAIDHRDADSSCRFELFGAGRSWLGPTWKIDADHAATSAPRPAILDLGLVRQPGRMVLSRRRGANHPVCPDIWAGARSPCYRSSWTIEPLCRSIPGLSVSLPRGIAAGADRKLPWLSS